MFTIAVKKNNPSTVLEALRINITDQATLLDILPNVI